MAPDAILFDLDGTLLDTIQDLTDSANAMLAHFGAPPHSTDDYKQMIGDGIEELVRRALPSALRSSDRIAEGVTLARAEYDERWNRKTRPYPGIPELLSALAARGIPVAVLSNKPDDFTKMSVRELLSGHGIDHVLGARPDVPRKPDPASAREIAAALGVDLSRCWYVGDSDVDMQTAVNAGMKPIGVLWGFRGEEELRANGAELLLSHPSELLPLLG